MSHDKQPSLEASVITFIFARVSDLTLAPGVPPSRVRPLEISLRGKLIFAGVDGNSVNIEHEEGENKFLVNVSRIFATLKKGLIEGTGQVQVNGSDNPKVINRGGNVEINGVGPKMIKPCGLAERPVLDSCSGFSSRKLIKEKWKVRKTLKVYKKKKVKKSKVVIGVADIIETETDVVITPPFDHLGEGMKIQDARKVGGVEELDEEEINSIIDGGDISYDDNPETDTILSDTDFSFSDDDEEEMRGKEYGKSVIDLDENRGWSEFLFRGGELSFSKAINKKLLSVVGSRIGLDLEGFKLNFLITAFIPVTSVLFFVGKDSSFPADGGGLKVAVISSFIDQENKEKSVVSDPIIPYFVPEVESEAMAVGKNSVPIIDYEQRDPFMSVNQCDGYSENRGTPASRLDLAVPSEENKWIGLSSDEKTRFRELLSKMGILMVDDDGLPPLNPASIPHHAQPITKDPVTGVG
ncbi:hypothetical protein LguiB_027232 [Lonicera macranthoides]